ncbi:diaminopimelate decarboxylase, partial [Phenylobacterium sp.]
AIRVNPDVSAGGHAKIATGKEDNKFGVSFSEAERLYANASNDAGLNPVGVTCHIGSQITDLAPMAAAFTKMRGLVERLRGEGLSVQRLDLGGGLGVPYFNQPTPPSPADYARMIAKTMNGLDIAYAFEPGRMIAANAGVLLAKVQHIHERPGGRKFVVLDAAMNDLIRPAMYDAYHEIAPLKPRAGDPVVYDVVGPICETGDTFTRERALPPLEAGDLIAFMSAGAYGAVMSSEYNSRLLVPEVLVKGDDYAVVRPRPTYEEMLAKEASAPWL